MPVDTVTVRSLPMPTAKMAPAAASVATMASPRSPDVNECDLRPTVSRASFDQTAAPLRTIASHSIATAHAPQTSLTRCQP